MQSCMHLHVFAIGALDLTCLQLDEDITLTNGKVQCFIQHAGDDMLPHVARCPVAAVAPCKIEALHLQLVFT